MSHNIKFLLPPSNRGALYLDVQRMRDMQRPHVVQRRNEAIIDNDDDDDDASLKPDEVITVADTVAPPLVELPLD